MSRPRFSKDYRTYGEWLKAQPRNTKYAKEIIRKHKFFPDKSLSQLRNPKIGDFDLSQTAWKTLSAQDKRDRNLSFQILREMRKGENLSSVLEKIGKRTEFAVKHLGKNLYKSGGNWRVTKADSIQVNMLIYSTEGQKTIVTASSKDRSLIGEYFASVQKAIKNNDPSVLAKFKDVQLVDAEGKVHHFETDLDKLYEILEAQEEPEFLEIYQH
ncbi:hypothetical protein EO98_19010 [Methanosarcina sp. 2.H.T.1A.6]|uniref:hypothetical protein n=2 Tax=unclassified Methanosarcina TaxID=2644672 RepID=UPI0006214915|nr:MULTISPECIES: hypothetical protein [unclassified Methanosarcina]KKG16568.1 hypothetical protein EO94_07335 [Methanosarcina sp. 2.H.T.1A.3]KKG19356.1 hypothetical protein EO98_19010 [Methanosarcina sp. 2.H.T.1A.6]KKG25602.1 hypothetical protein EO96_18835 [Methanosarcina sp. 2.H.T.1A.8]KKG26538.1 hypothetical protein EO97_05750 [Methanosarcina sp. 2.H.T.1A.15]